MAWHSTLKSPTVPHLFSWAAMTVNHELLRITFLNRLMDRPPYSQHSISSNVDKSTNAVVRLGTGRLRHLNDVNPWCYIFRISRPGTVAVDPSEVAIVDDAAVESGYPVVFFYLMVHGPHPIFFSLPGSPPLGVNVLL